MSAVLVIGASSAVGRALAEHYLQCERVVMWLVQLSQQQGSAQPVDKNREY